MFTFSSAPEALKYLFNHPIEAALIDFRLQGPDGLMLAKRIRAMHPDCAIVVVSRFAGQTELERGYQAGIDDFILRPCPNGILFKRFTEAIERKARLRQNAGRKKLDPVLVLQFLNFDSATRTIDWHGERMKLTQLEVRLLTCLTSEARYFTYSDLCLMLTGEEMTVAEASRKLRNPLNRLRQKLEAGDRPRMIQATRRRGFCWAAEKLPPADDPN